MIVGRYHVYRELARGGMGTVHLARTTADFGVGRVVAAKRLHAHVATDPQFVGMFLDEARLCARVRHRNVVSLLDLVSVERELCMVLEYVEGETLAKLIEAARDADERIPDRIVAGVIAGALHGLHAAHEARAEDGAPLGIVHRDFTPQNVLVGVDGTPRVADFGVAKAAVRLQTTRDGQLKGKLGYMAPEQVSGGEVDRRTDIFAAGVVLWETLTRKRLLTGENEGEILMKIVRGGFDPPSDHAPGLDPGWDRIVETALALAAADRYPTARAMALAIEAAFPSATASEIGEWVATHARENLAKRAAWVSEVERAAAEPASAPTPSRPEPSAASAAPARSSNTDLRAGRGRRWSGKVAGAAVVVLAATATVAAWRGSATSSERRLDPEPAPTASEPAPLASVAAPPAEVDSTTPVVEPSPSSTANASPDRVAPPPTGPRRPPPPKASSASAPAAGCRYFDEKAKIWRFRRECYR